MNSQPSLEITNRRQNDFYFAGQTPTQYRGAFWSYVLGSHVEQYVRICFLN